MTRPTLALLLAMGACTATAGPAPGTGSSGADIRVELTSRRLEPPTLQEPARPGAPPQENAASAEGEAGRIVVRGQMQTPDPCRKLTGRAEAAGEEVTLRVEAVREGEMCAQVIAAFGYDASIGGLAPGTYRLRVIHTYPATGWDTQTALDQRVTVR